MSAGRIVSLIVLVLFLALGGVAGYLLTHPDSTAQVKMKIAEAPADDAPLRQWLSSQTQLSKPVITRTGSGPDTALIVEYNMSNYRAGDYAPTLVAECKRLGYNVNGYSSLSNGNPFREYGPNWRN